MLREERILRKCKVCHKKYKPLRPMQTVCGEIDCLIGAAEIAREKKIQAEEKRERQRIRERKQELKPIQYWLKRAEKACNAYVRARDADQPCISCGTWDADEWHAGHFLPVGRAKSIRFDAAGINRQCSQCNTHFNGNATLYEVNLIKKIGLADVERLKTAPKEKKWTREECQEIEAKYKQLTKGLESVS